MNEQGLFIRANETLHGVIRQLRPEQMDLTIPDEMSWRPGQTLRTAMNVYAYENACVPGVSNGDAKQPSNDEARDDLLGEHPADDYSRYSDAADAAVRALADPSRIVHISYGDFPASDYLRDVTIQRGLGAYDTAKFIGADTALPADLVQGLWSMIVPIAEQLRELGVFGPRVEVTEDAPLQDRLLGLTGRQP